MIIDNDYVDKFSKDLEQWTNSLVADFTAFDNTKDAMINVFGDHEWYCRKLVNMVKEQRRRVLELQSWLRDNHERIEVRKDENGMTEILYTRPTFDLNKPIGTAKVEKYTIAVWSTFNQLYTIMERSHNYRYNDGICLTRGITNFSDNL